MAEFAPHNMTSNSDPAPYVAAASTCYCFGIGFPYQAFDGNSGGSYWLGTNGGADWLRIDLGSGNSKALSYYEITVNSVPEPTRAPKNWTMEGSTDATSWTVLDTIVGETSWSSGETRSFICDSPNGTPYRYYRINITANNGDATYTQIGELYLYEEAVATTVSISDSLPLTDGGTRLSYPEVKAFQFLEDSLNLSDTASIEIGLEGLAFTRSAVDTFTFSDSAAIIISQLNNYLFNDSFFLIDSIALQLGGGIEIFIQDNFSFNDTLNSLSPNEKLLADTIILNDAARIGHGLLFTDSNTLTDILTLTREFVFGDTFNFADSVLYSLNVPADLQLTASTNDILQYFDSVEIALSGSLVSRGDHLEITDSIQVNLQSNRNSYLRRYLNDTLR